MSGGASPARLVALRIARRDVVRAKGRSSLVVAMVGIPVLLVVALATLIRSNDVSAREALSNTLGRSQASIEPSGREPIWQDANGVNTGSRSTSAAKAPAPWTATELQRLTGGRILERRSGTGLLTTTRGRTRVDVLEVDAREAALRGTVTVTSGRAPRSPGEVLVSAAVNARDRLTLNGRPRQVVGTMRLPDSPRGTLTVLGLPHALLPADASTSYLLDRATSVRWAEVRALNGHGLKVVSRAVVEHPPAASALPPEVRQSSTADTTTRAVLIIAVTSILVEVVLLAGPAFAVGVRRQRRQMALLLAVGGDASDVRRTVLASALVLGAGSAVCGALLGVLAARIAIPLAEAHTKAVFGPFDVSRWDLVAAVALGSVASLGAAWLPARAAARTDVVAVLAGRRGTVRSRRGLPVLGAVVAAVGVGVTFTIGTRPGGEIFVAAATVLLVIAALLALPAILGGLGRLAPVLPLPLRLALRDAARNRARTVPAVAAVMGVVGGVTALAIGGTSDFEQSRRDYTARFAAGVGSVSAYDARTDWAAIDAATARALPGRHAEVLRVLGRNGTGGNSLLTVYVPRRGCPTPAPATDLRCSSWATPQTTTYSTVYEGLVAEPAALQLLGVPLTAPARSVLAAGGALVTSADLIAADGKATIAIVHPDSNGGRATLVSSRRLPAAVLAPHADAGVLAGVALTPQTATRLGLPTYRQQLLLPPTTSRAAQKQINEVAQGASPGGSEVYVERGFQESFSLPLALLAIVGAVAVLVGTATATGLAITDARPDLATLTAVGARPRTRRALAGGQALVIGLLGALLGVALGAVPGVAVTRPLTISNGPNPHGPIVAVPWLLLLFVAVAVPLLAAVGAGLLTRSSPVLSRRAAL